jgi:hypothetical protein
MMRGHGLDGSPRRGQPHYLWHPVLLLLFLVVAFVGVDAVAQLERPDDAIHGDLTASHLCILAAAGLIAVFEIVSAVLSIFRKNPRRAFFHGLAISVLILAAVFGRQLALGTQYINLWLFSATYQACERSAEAYDGSARLKLCSAQSFGNTFRMIVYDSGGQVALPTSQRSEAFRYYIRSKGLPALRQCRVEPGEKLSGDFYFVRSDCDSQPSN